MTLAADGPRRSDATRNRARVLEIARERLDAGDELPPMKDLARLAGVGVGTVYRHFATQQELLAELGAAGTRRLVTATRAALDDDPAAGFERIVGFVLRNLVHDQGVCAALTGAGSDCGPGSEPVAELNSAVEELMDRARRAGVVREEVDADDIRLLLLGVATALRRSDADDERVERYLRVLLDGLRGHDG